MTTNEIKINIVLPNTSHFETPILNKSNKMKPQCSYWHG